MTVVSLSFFETFAGYLDGGNERSLTPFLADGVATSRLQVYRNGYVLACLDALRREFPTVLSLVGDDYFRSCAIRYIDAHPPSKRSLSGYGHRFAAFLDDQAANPTVPYLSDFARLDTAWLEVYFAAGGSHLKGALVQQRIEQGHPVDDMTFALAPTVRLVSTAWEVSDAWQRLRDQGALEAKIQVAQGNESTLVWRCDETIRIRSLPPAERVLLQEIAKATKLGDAVDTAAGHGDIDLTEVFAGLLSNQILQDTPI